MSKATRKSAYANRKIRYLKLMAGKEWAAFQWEEIIKGRLDAEESRQLRAERLGRDSSPMPGYEDFVNAELS